MPVVKRNIAVHMDPLDAHELHAAPETRKCRSCPRNEEHNHRPQLLPAGTKDLIRSRLQRGVPVPGDGAQIRVHLLHVRRHRRSNGRDADRRYVGQLEGAGWYVQGAV